MTKFEETQRSFTAHGARLHYNDAGQGVPLICLHGGGPGANGWDNTKWALEELAAHFRVLMLDLPGYGRSEHMEAAPDEASDSYYARAVLALMDELKIEKAHLFGPSMGGAPMIRLAHDHPERVLKLVLKSPAGMGVNLFTTTPPDGIKALGVFRADPSYENMAQIMRLFIPRPELLTKDMIDARFASAQLAMEHKPPRQAPAAQSDIRALLPKLAMPTLVFWGHQDRMVPLDGALTPLALIPDVQVHVWGGGTGHFVEYEHADAFNRVVIPFLES